MSNFYELIQKIKKRPSMYLGKPAISNLRSCLAGYILARRELGKAFLRLNKKKSLLNSKDGFRKNSTSPPANPGIKSFSSTQKMNILR